MPFSYFLFLKQEVLSQRFGRGKELLAMPINTEDFLMLAKSVSPLEDRDSKLLKVSITHGVRYLEESASKSLGLVKIWTTHFGTCLRVPYVAY